MNPPRELQSYNLISRELRAAGQPAPGDCGRRRAEGQPAQTLRTPERAGHGAASGYCTVLLYIVWCRFSVPGSLRVTARCAGAECTPWTGGHHDPSCVVV